ncbi:6-phosphogluconolactonase [Nocardioides sp. dk4132]|uniref:6-phosphogluconolactonase n=1 Tax=unclassified Nocardioides TaxID=2615069 RepID=UPI001295AA75|nr:MULTISPECIES: 6-phosphogluconolactonase [unclassified Nocardioides]MQW75063.1 6-phosphogluconolactonase [Nocardioides sp. dk4132]QGA07765.1 6-phosphogluconolactonase [Nocardioides sp. dk884]
MTEARLVRHEDAATLATAVARALLERLAAVQAEGREPQVVLTGGTIAREVHREVARLTPGSGVDWSRVVVWWGDERFVPAEDPERNAGQAHADLLDHVPVDAAKVFAMASTDTAVTAEEGADVYAAQLAAHCPDGFDVVMLGLGPDAHVASLFPGQPALDVTGRAAVAVHDSPKPPPTRISLTFDALARARAVWLLVSGEGKADAVAQALATPRPARHDVPAAWVGGTDETVFHLDLPAASRLP